MSYNLKDFENDFVFLLEIKSYLKEYLSKDESQIDEDVVKKGLYSKLRDGRPVRIVIPHGFKQLKDISVDNNLYFVGFIGYAKPSHQIPDNLTDKIWKIDYKLIDEFSGHNDILAYVSAERTGGKDWGNLVLLKSMEAVEKWRDCSIHQEAITYVYIYIIYIW